MRIDNRTARELRPVQAELGFHRLAEGSCLYRAGGTVVLCTVSVDEGVPRFLEGRESGWLTAEYQMHPRANPKRREARDGRGKAIGGRTQEIQRLVGRALRAVVDLKRLGPRTLVVDCDVLEADGGTRTAAVTGGFLALCAAIAKLRERGDLFEPVLSDQLAAISVGHVDGKRLLDLCYAEDSQARFDLNVVATASACLVEVQGTAEAAPISRADLDAMVDLALEGIAGLCRMQRETLGAYGISLDELVCAPTSGPLS
jgi:ribonuclease PH